MNVSQEEFTSLTHKAMMFASENLFYKAEEILSYLLEKSPSHQEASLSEVILLNNLAYIHQKTGNSHKSLSLLSRAYTFKPLSDQDLSYFLATLMNMSTINCTLGYYQQSLQQAFKALELSNKENLPELKATAYYNLSSILIILNRVSKASYFFREASTIAQSLLGPKHHLTILSQKASSACLGPESFHVRIKSSGYTSKNTSFSTSTTRVSKYVAKAIEVEELENKLKINLSTKIATIGKIGKNVVHKVSVVGSPYVKGVKSGFRIDAGLLKSAKKDGERGMRIKKIGKEFYFRGKVEERVRRVKEIFEEIEKEMEEFKNGCKEASEWVGFEEGVLDNRWAIVMIQRWWKWTRRRIQ